MSKEKAPESKPEKDWFLMSASQRFYDPDGDNEEAVGVLDCTISAEANDAVAMTLFGDDETCFSFFMEPDAAAHLGAELIREAERARLMPEEPEPTEPQKSCRSRLRLIKQSLPTRRN